MTLLLDAHILLWWLASDSKIPKAAASAIADGTSAVVVSAATIWEIAIKQVAGRLDAPEDLLEAIAASDFDTLPISAAHAFAAAQLPHHHGDPFDRMLIAQARTESLTLVTVDRRFSEYEVALLLPA